MKKLLSLLFCVCLLLPAASAHPGRTDYQGGHWDNSTGSYHFHHGYPAHQHTDGVCPYDFDDRTGISSGSSAPQPEVPEDPEVSEVSDAPDGYPIAESYMIATGSRLIDRTYYFNENGFMWIPWTKENLPHGDIETDNEAFLQYGDPYLGDVIYQYGLENQSQQFQEGATFGLHEAQCYYDYWYECGYKDGQEEADTSTAENIEIPYDRDDGTYETAYNIGYTTGCAELIELHTDLLPDVGVLTGSLSKSNRLADSTPLDDMEATFESAFYDGYHQSETDFFTALNNLITAERLADDANTSANLSDVLYEDAYQKGASEAYRGILSLGVAACVIGILLRIYYKHKKTRS